MSKTAAGHAAANTRGLHTIVDKLDIHTRTLVRLEEKVDVIKRSVTKYDRPVTMGELRSNPDLNPWLQGYLPFNEQALVADFFESQDRNYELTRYVLASISWDPSHFVPRMVSALCTEDYRIKYSFPGKAT